MKSRAPKPLAVAVAGSRLEVVEGVWRLSVATAFPPLLYDPPDASLRAASPEGGEHLGAARRCSFAASAAISGPGPGDDDDEEDGTGGGGSVGGNIDPDDDEDGQYEDEDDDDEDPLLCALARG